MDIKNTIAVGYKDGKHARLLPWKNSNGIIVAGVPGSGKTYTASWLLAQYAYNGTSLVICDYGASQTTEQTLLEGIDYISHAYLLPPVSEAEAIVAYINKIKELGELRYNGTIRKKDHYPIIFVIDEFPAFITNFKPPKAQTTRVSGSKNSDEGETRITQDAPTFLDDLLTAILKLRKVNIHFMLIGQEWAQISTVGMRAIRSNIKDKIIHRLDKNGAVLFGFESKEEKKIIQTLKVGQSFFEGDILQTPRMTDVTLNALQERVESFPKRSTELWGSLEPLLTQAQKDMLSDKDLLQRMLTKV